MSDCYSYMSDTEEDQLPPTLDTAWITTLKDEEVHYRDFYTEPVDTVKLCCCYINEEAEVETLKTEQLHMQTTGVVSREELMRLIHQHQWPNYKLLSVLRYNVNLNADEVPDFIQTSSPLSHYAPRFLTSEKYLNNIAFPNTITIFNDLNTLILVFRQKGSDSISTTRKIKLVSKTHQRKGTRRH